MYSTNVIRRRSTPTVAGITTCAEYETQQGATALTSIFAAVTPRFDYIWPAKSVRHLIAIGAASSTTHASDQLAGCIRDSLLHRHVADPHRRDLALSANFPES